jgi:hypothetical protein
MLYLAAKAAISGVIVAVASETARRSPALGALIVSLPLTSLLALVWLWHDAGDTERVAALAQSTFWYVLPTLPMFLLLLLPLLLLLLLLLLLPLLLRHGAGFWPALAAACALTVALYLVTVWILAKFGVTP